jgi:hypothetical protein
MRPVRSVAAVQCGIPARFAITVRAVDKQGLSHVLLYHADITIVIDTATYLSNGAIYFNIQRLQAFTLIDNQLANLLSVITRICQSLVGMLLSCETSVIIVLHSESEGD